MKFGCSRQIFEKKKLKYQNFMKIRQVGVFQCGRMEGETKKLIVAFRNFANAPKNKYLIEQLIVTQLVSKFPTE